MNEMPVCSSMASLLQATGLHFRHTDNVIQWLNAMTEKGLPKVTSCLLFIPNPTVLHSPSLCSSLSSFNHKDISLYSRLAVTSMTLHSLANVPEWCSAEAVIASHSSRRAGTSLYSPGSQGSLHNCPPDFSDLLPRDHRHLRPEEHAPVHLLYTRSKVVSRPLSLSLAPPPSPPSQCV